MAIPETVFTHIVEGKLEDAESVLVEHLSERPLAWDAQLELSRVYLALQRFEEAEEQFSSLLTHEEAGPEAIGLRGLWHQMQGSAGAAEADFRASLESLPEQSAVLFNLGKLLVQSEELTGERATEAEEMLTRALSLEPNHFQAQFELASLYTRRGQLDKAVEACRLTIALNPLFVRAYLFLGTVFSQAGKVEEVIELYKAALLNNPLAHIFRDELIRLCQLAGKTEEAYQLAIAQSNLRGACEDYLQVGNLALQLAQPQVAEVAFMKAEQVFPEGWRAPYNLGELYRGAQQYDAATEAFQRSLALTPTGCAHTGLGLVFFEQEGEAALESAVEHFRQAVHHGPAEGYVLLNLAYALKKADLQQEIDSFLEDVGTLFSQDNPTLLEIRSILS